MSNDQFKDFPAIGGLMVSNMISQEKQKVMFMYREKPMDEMDSGWRLFSGLEDQEYVDDASNTQIYSAESILEIDPSIAGLLLSPVGSAFEREEEDAEWYDVDDFEFDDDYMVTRKLDDEWSIEINNMFLLHAEGDDFVFVMKGKTVRFAIWAREEASRNELYNEHLDISKTRDGDEAVTLEIFDISDENVSKVGYMIEESDGSRKYKVIYAFSIVDGQIVQMALYFDDDADKEWALNTWRSVRYAKDGKA